MRFYLLMWMTRRISIMISLLRNLIFFLLSLIQRKVLYDFCALEFGIESGDAR